jgi:ribosome recycling factor
MDKLIKKNGAEHMQKTIDHLAHELSTVRTGRASATLLDMVKVDYFGTPSAVKHVASVSVPDARTIMIQPFQTNMLAALEKAILASDLGLTPSNDGHVIRLTIPQLTEDRRKDLMKLVKKMGEETKVAIRNIRREMIEKLRQAEKDGHVTEDDMHRAEKEVQDLTDDFTKKIDEIVISKEKEVMTV